MSFTNSFSSPGREPDTSDPVFKTLVTPAQRSVAFKIWRLCDSFPWDIIPCSTKTTWTQGLLECFLEAMTLTFSGQRLSDLDKRKMRSALMGVAQRKDVGKPITITKTNIRRALALLKKADSQPESGLETPMVTRTLSPTAGSKPPARKPAAKRVRAEYSNPPARATRSSKRQRGEAPRESPQTPVPKCKPVDTVVISSDDESDLDEAEDRSPVAKEEPNDNQSEPELSHSDDSSPNPDSQLLETAAEHEKRNVLSTLFQDAEEVNPGTASVSLAHDGSKHSSASPPRKIHVASLSIIDQQIGDQIRKRLSFIAHKQQPGIEQRQAELDAEANGARQALLEADSANHGMVQNRERKRNAISAALKRSEKARADYEKTVEALEYVQNLGVSNVASAVKNLEKAVEDADKDQIVARAAYDNVCNEFSSFEEYAEDVKRALNEADAKFREVCQRKYDLKEASDEKKIACTIRMATDARDDEGNSFDDFILEFDATVRQKVPE